MLKVNEYFEGRVKSISLENEEERATVGVMAPGEYEFGTSSTEYMTVISGKLRVYLPGASDWADFSGGDTFVVEKDNRFRLIVTEESAYKCVYR